MKSSSSKDYSVSIAELNSTDLKDADIEKLDVLELPPIDGGRRAWSFLIGAFMIEGLLYGFPLLFGVFQEHLRKHTSFGNNPFLSNVGTLSIGIAKLFAPVMTPLIIRYQAKRRQMIWVGWVICILALVMASFFTEMWHLVFFQGLLFGIGWLVLYYPLLSLLNEWFVVKRGFAYGILFASEGLFGLGLPFLMEILLHEYGYAWTLRIYAIATLVLVGPTLPLLYGRNPIELSVSKGVRIEKNIFSQVAFTAMSFANMFQGLVVFLPTLLFPGFAISIGLSASQGTLILSITNVATIIGMAGLGYLADIMDSQLLSFTICTLASLSAFFLWGFATNLVLLLLFSIAHGIFASSYSVLYSRFATALTNDTGSQTWLYSVFEAQRGALVIVGGLFGGALVSAGGEVREGTYGVGRYKQTVLVVGASLTLSALGGVGWFFRDTKFKFQTPVKLVKLKGLAGDIKEKEDKPPQLPALKLDYYPSNIDI